MARNTDPSRPKLAKPRQKEIERSLGMRMRQLRKTLSLSMQTVAERAGLSVGLISQIERGLTSPSIRSLRLMAMAMDLPVERFFTRSETPPGLDVGHVVRPRTRRVLVLEHAGITIQIISPESEGTLQMFLADLEPGSRSGAEMDTHEGEESGLVLAGQLELWLGDKHFHLHEGDSFQFSSRTPHRYANPGETTARVQWVVTPPIYSLSDGLPKALSR